tara:strand:- start:134 stop:274 length:141 start_codon:yes stop_codon:yes gene_type:complete
LRRGEEDGRRLEFLPRFLRFVPLLSHKSFTVVDEAEDYFYSGDFCL